MATNHLPPDPRNTDSTTPDSPSARDRNFPYMAPSTLSNPVTQRVASSTFQPRVVRGTIGRDLSIQIHNPTTSPISGGPRSASLSPTRTRRPSATPTSPRIPRVSGSGPSFLASPSAQTSQILSATFPRPEYLEHSAFHNLLQSEPTPYQPSSPVSARRHLPNRSQPSRSRTNIPYPSSPSPDASEDENRSWAIPRNVPNPTQAREREDVRLKLPTRWNEADRHHFLNVTNDGFDVTYTGASQPDKDAAGIRANHPIPPACGVYYFEVEILNRGNKGHIGIGLGAESVRLSRLPGWEKDSWGYHGDDGKVFHSDGESPYGPKFTICNVIGCGVDYTLGSAFFTRDGVFLGHIFKDLPGGLYPFVGLRTAGESVRTNFGQHAFKFDIDSYMQQARGRHWAKIMRTQASWKIDSQTIFLSTAGPTEPLSSVARIPLPEHLRSRVVEGAEPTDNIHVPIREIVLDYLVHNGYAKAAQKFKDQASHDRLQELKNVQEVTSLAVDASKRAASGTSTPAGRSSKRSSVLGSKGGGMVTGTSGTSTPELMQNTNISRIVDPPIGSFAIPEGLGEGINPDETMVRQSIVAAVLRGDIDTALKDTATYYHQVLNESGPFVVGDGLMQFKLRCRKLVEVILDAAETNRASNGEREMEWKKMQQDGMDVDDDIPPPSTNLKQKQKQKQVARPISPVTTNAPSLNKILDYGRLLQADYKDDMRPGVQTLLHRTSGLVAYEDPLNASEVGEDLLQFAGQQARDELANELNRCILESQGRRMDSVLERMYRQAAGTVFQLGIMGEGQAAFANMEKELLGR